MGIDRATTEAAERSVWAAPDVLKEQGFRVHRDELGRWHIFDPDGIEIV